PGLLVKNSRNWSEGKGSWVVVMDDASKVVSVQIPSLRTKDLSPTAGPAAMPGTGSALVPSAPGVAVVGADTGAAIWASAIAFWSAALSTAAPPETAAGAEAAWSYSSWASRSRPSWLRARSGSSTRKEV